MCGIVGRLQFPATVAFAAAGLVKRFKAVTAVNGVSLTVRAGVIVGLPGPNGAGKPTALRMLTGMLTPTGCPWGIQC